MKRKNLKRISKLLFVILLLNPASIMAKDISNNVTNKDLEIESEKDISEDIKKLEDEIKKLESMDNISSEEFENILYLLEFLEMDNENNLKEKYLERIYKLEEKIKEDLDDIDDLDDLDDKDKLEKNNDEMTENLDTEKIIKEINISTFSVNDWIDSEINIGGELNENDLIEEENGKVVVVDNKEIKISGKNEIKKLENIQFRIKNNGKLILENIEIDNDNKKETIFSPIFIEDDSNNIVEFKGDNILRGSFYGAGIAVNNKGYLNEKEVDTKVSIIGDGNLKIYTGFKDTGRNIKYNGAPIGGERKNGCGDITIKDNINIDIYNIGKSSSIGAGAEQGKNDNGSITITENAKINSIYDINSAKKYGRRWDGSVIGNGSGPIKAGSGKIEISGNSVLNLSSYSSNSAVIGTTRGGRLDKIIIKDNATINAAKDCTFVGGDKGNKGYNYFYFAAGGTTIGEQSSGNGTKIKEEDIILIDGNPTLNLGSKDSAFYLREGKIKINGGKFNIQAHRGIFVDTTGEIDIENADMDIRSFVIHSKEDIEYNANDNIDESFINKKLGYSPGIGFGYSYNNKVDDLVKINIKNSNIKIDSYESAAIGAQWHSTTKFDINIENSDLNLNSEIGAGIGTALYSESSGTINIKNMKDKDFNINTMDGAGIGFGRSTSGNIDINLSDIDNININSKRGAGIGTGIHSKSSGTINIKNIKDKDFNINTIGGAGIGFGQQAIGNLDINLRDIDNLKINSQSGAGIGTGSFSGYELNDIVKFNANLENVSSSIYSLYGAGIGMGNCSYSTEAFNVKIKDSDLFLDSVWGSGIGAGRTSKQESSLSGEIKIDGGNIIARSSAGSAIGLGGSSDIEKYSDKYKNKKYLGTLLVTNDAKINAQSGGERPAITSVLEDGSDRLIMNNTFVDEVPCDIEYTIKLSNLNKELAREIKLLQSFVGSSEYTRSYAYTTNNNSDIYTEEISYIKDDYVFTNDIIQVEKFKKEGRHPEEMNKFNSVNSYRGPSKEVLEDKTIVEIKKIKKIDIKFNANGGSVNDKEIDIIKIDKGSTVESQKATRDGYNFLGWFKNLEDEKAFDFKETLDKDLELFAKWEIKKIDIKFNANGGTVNDKEIDIIEIDKGSTVESQSATRDGYKFLGWFRNLEDEKAFDFDTTLDKDLELFAKWEIVEEEISEEEDKEKEEREEREEREDEEDKKDIDTEKEDNKEEIVVGKISERLNREDHMRYLEGYPDETIKPNGDITREEVSAVLFRLLDDDYRDVIRCRGEACPLYDVHEGRWSKKHINTMINGNIVKGFSDGKFYPDRAITRAELITMIDRLDDFKYTDETKEDLKDIKGHWAEKAISSGIQKGWVIGFEDDTFKPDDELTRAEFTVVMNRILNRVPNEKSIPENVRKYKDLDKSDWYYYDFVEACNCHKYEKNKDGTMDWKAVINSENEM